MLFIKQVRYNSDNLGYLMYGEREAVAIDAGAPDIIMDFIRDKQLTITCITNTHHHGDHTQGNRRLHELTGAPVKPATGFSHNEKFDIDDQPITVYRTPGHSTDSIIFSSNGALITGDTLFNGTVGNCFTGDLDAFFNSIRLILAFPDETVIYAGHDYVKESIAFTRALMPGLADMDTYLNGYDPAHVRSTLGDEKKINPYLKFDDPEMIRLLKDRGIEGKTSKDRWIAIMNAF